MISGEGRRPAIWWRMQERNGLNEKLERKRRVDKLLAAKTFFTSPKFRITSRCRMPFGLQFFADALLVFSSKNVCSNSFACAWRPDVVFSVSFASAETIRVFYWLLSYSSIWFRRWHPLYLSKPSTIFSVVWFECGILFTVCHFIWKFWIENGLKATSMN